MSLLKTHFEIIIQPPNESDPEGYSVLACGREDAAHVTTLTGLVDCKNCLRRSNNKQNKDK